MIFPSYFPRLFHPSVYQGKKNPKNYFEGWYYKHVDKRGKNIWSFIFGISHSDDPHCFIQIIEGQSGKTDYIRFDTDAFQYNKKSLFIQIGNNRITSESMELDVQGEVFSIKGKLKYSELNPFPQSMFAPGIMGWYTYAPFMECYHGVVSMNHTISGTLKIGSEDLDFTGGKGYIEKDRGRSMPTDWVWVQCNHFSADDGISMMLSIARIPWLTGHFPGFLSFLKIGNHVYRFATYNASRIVLLEIESEMLKIKLENRRHILELVIDRSITGQLKAPVKGEMQRKIAESLNAKLKLKLFEKRGKLLFEGHGSHAGLEIVGDVSQYLR